MHLKPCKEAVNAGLAAAAPMNGSVLRRVQFMEGGNMMPGGGALGTPPVLQGSYTPATEQYLKVSLEL